jgi:hypothetical protein
MFQERVSPVLLLLALCGAGCQGPATQAVAPGPPPSLTLANFEKVRVGMTLPEVEAILGRPGAWTTEDVKRPDGSTTREVQSASWLWVRVSAPAGGGPTRQEDRHISVQLKDGKVASKEQAGLD